jgi:hypothetical protein
MTLLGYVSDSPQAAAIYLKAKRGVLMEPELGEVSDPLSPLLAVFSGKKAVRDSLRASDAIQPVHSLAARREASSNLHSRLRGPLPSREATTLAAAST